MAELISIHAPHAGSDNTKKSRSHSKPDFNPRSPCGERLGRYWNIFWTCNFNPRSPCGERLSSQQVNINVWIFQSTLPMRGATGNHESPPGHHISIHAPHAGSDKSKGGVFLWADQFQSTLPMRGATIIASTKEQCIGISIHAPHAGSDDVLLKSGGTVTDFNPRSPCGERLMVICMVLSPLYFNPRSPCGERISSMAAFSFACHFNPRSPCGERPSDQIGMTLYNDFNPRSPCGERIDVAKHSVFW